MKVIILVAGKGERLMPLTKNTPKSLLELGNGETILERQLQSIKKCNINEVVLVVGYKAEQIEAKIKDISDMNIQAVYNPFFDVSNNLVSAWMAKEYMKEDFIILNGDVIFKHSVMEDLLKVDSEISMVLDRKNFYSDEDMKAVTENDQVLEVSKKIPADKSNAESIGMIKFQGKGKDKFVATLDALVRDKDNLNKFYLYAMQEVMNEGFLVRHSECSEQDWSEVDFHPDLKTVRNNLSRFTQIIENW